MKRGMFAIFILVLVLTFSLSFVSASFFGDLFGKLFGNGESLQLSPQEDFIANFGEIGDMPVSGEWKTQISGDEIGVFRGGEWYLDDNGDGIFNDGLVTSHEFLERDFPIFGNWDSDPENDIGIFRSVNGVGWWYLDMNNNNLWDDAEDINFGFGLAGDIPIIGDWNGDGRDNVGVFRATTDGGFFYLDLNGNNKFGPNDAGFVFSSPNAVPVAGDWNGNGSDWIGVFEGGVWYLDINSNMQWDDDSTEAFGFGLAGDMPIVGDWNGDGKDNIGVVRGTEFYSWFLDGNGNYVWDYVACADLDSDGYNSSSGGICGDVDSIDCDDANPNIHPGATEICTYGYDEDCDGLSDMNDPDCLPVINCDLDGDGFAVDNSTCGGDDCDDFDLNINPGMIEICGNDVDEDCSGFAEYCACFDDDGGRTFYLAGTIIGGGLGDVGNSDSCSGNVLTEWSCETGIDGRGAVAINETFACPNGCSNGACSLGTGNPFSFASGGSNFITLDASLVSADVSVAMLYGNGTDFEGIGEDATHKLIVSNTNNLIFDSDTDDYFVVSWSNETDAQSYLMRATGFKSENAGEINKTTFEYKDDSIASGWREAKVDAQKGDNVYIGNIEFSVGVINKDSKTVEISAGTDVVFDKIYNLNKNYVDLTYAPDSFSVATVEIEIYDISGGKIETWKAYWENNEAKISLKSAEICDDGIDNDLDALVDCEDEIDCRVSSACEPVASCVDLDDGKDYYVAGEVNYSIDGVNYAVDVDVCTNNGLEENYCDGDVKKSVVYQCPFGCSDGACVTPEWGFACEPLGEGQPPIQPKTRVNATTYCDPLTLTYNSLSSKDAVCSGDYECESNVCIDGKCTSVGEELREQKSLLTMIWCAILNPIDVFDRCNGNQPEANNDFVQCMTDNSQTVDCSG